jgi:phage tail tape-measure protein
MTEHNHPTDETILNRGEPKSANPDPITGEPGSHPVGVGLGAAGGGLGGAAIGSAAGPIGAAVGAVAGAIIGGMAGKDIAESYDPTAEDAFWRQNYRDRPYVTANDSYERLRPAFRYGWEAQREYAGRQFDEFEPELQQRWMTAKPGMGWDHARHAARDAWERMGAMASAREASARDATAPGTGSSAVMPTETRGQSHPGAPNTAPVDRGSPERGTDAGAMGAMSRELEARDL